MKKSLLLVSALTLTLGTSLVQAAAIVKVINSSNNQAFIGNLPIAAEANVDYTKTFGSIPFKDNELEVKTNVDTKNKLTFKIEQTEKEDGKGFDITISRLKGTGEYSKPSKQKKVRYPENMTLLIYENGDIALR